MKMRVAEARIVKNGEIRRIQYDTSSPRWVCALKGIMSQIGVITTINPIIRIASKPSQMARRLAFELELGADMRFITL